jgi:hypothetical protein
MTRLSAYPRGKRAVAARDRLVVRRQLQLWEDLLRLLLLFGPGGFPFPFVCCCSLVFFRSCLGFAYLRLAGPPHPLLPRRPRYHPLVTPLAAAIANTQRAVIGLAGAALLSCVLGGTRIDFHF